MRMHNLYAHLYNQIVFDLLKRRLGEGEAVVFARSAHAGGQRFPVVCTFIWQLQPTFNDMYSTGVAIASQPMVPWLNHFAVV
jgi:hypothetical protein